MEKSIDKVKQWAAERNIIVGSDSKTQVLKLMSEVGELADNINKKADREQIKDDIGDCLVVLTIIATQQGLSLKECIDHAYDEIKHRRGIMLEGVFIKESDPAYHNALAMLAGKDKPDAKCEWVNMEGRCDAMEWVQCLTCGAVDNEPCKRVDIMRNVARTFTKN